MSLDYYASCREKLTAAFSSMEEAYAEFKAAADDRDARRKAEDKIRQAAGKATELEPHLAYLWYEANGSDLANRIRDAWRNRRTAGSIPQSFYFHPDVAAVEHMPHLSFALCIPFRLRKPYLSRDECDFYLLDNPVRKDKIFQVPMVASTSWKGVLRGVLCAQIDEWWNGLDEQSRAAWKYRRELVPKRRLLTRLFGNERGADKRFFAGRLHFYSTFFDRDQIAIEVINPHDRATGIGKQPILMESVRAQAQGDLVIVYVPFGPIDQSEEKRRAEVAQDILALCQGIQAMLAVFGFGAKTSSSFGVVEDKLPRPGILAIRAALPNLAKGPAAQSKSNQEPLARYLESKSSLHPDFRNASGDLKSEADYQALVKSKGQQYGKQDKQLYDKARKWWEQRKNQAAVETPQQPAPESPASAALPVVKVEFGSLKKLCEAAEEIKAELMRGENA
jgi:CRISPR-associated protein Cmr2